jgi:hypothetical protein
MILFILLMKLWLDTKCQATLLSQTPNEKFWCAKYLVVIDYTRLQSIDPTLPLSVTSNLYYIQYGDKKVIRIADPGPETKAVPLLITEWDYQNKVSTAEVIINDSKLYYTKTDSINFLIEDSRGIINNYCNSSKPNSFCDSVLITANLDKSTTRVYFGDSICNILSTELFYPDIQYLPSKIVPNKKGRSARILQIVLFGKSSVDSLLNQYKHIGFEKITEEEMNKFMLENPIKSIQALIPTKD